MCKRTYSVRRKATLYLGIWIVVMSGCGSDAVLLPSDFNAQKVKQITVDFQTAIGTVQALPGLQGGPKPTIVGDADLSNLHQVAGIDRVRLPQGYLCEYTLSGVFPDPTAAVDDPASYQLDALDGVVSAAVALGEQVLLQSIYDVGAETCQVDADGIQLVAPPADAALWASVMVNVLRYFNADLLNPNAPTAKLWLDAGARDYRVRHVEFIDDPMGTGGYAEVGQVVDDYVALGSAVKAAFPNNADGTFRIAVVGPAMVVESASLAGQPLETFLNELKTRGEEALLDVVSIQTRVRFPRENREIVSAVRAWLDENGFAETPLWVTRYQPDPAYLLEPTSELEVPAWSAFAGAFATASRIHWQDELEAAFFYRGDRRHRSKSGSDILRAEQSPLWSGKATWRPAGVAWQAWRLLVDETRLAVSGVSPEDDDGLAVLSARVDGQTCADGQGDNCSTVYVLVANSNTHLGQTQLSYQLAVSGLSTESQQVRVSWSTINAATTEFTFVQSSLVSVGNGTLFYQLESSVPAVDFLQIELGLP